MTTQSYILLIDPFPVRREQLRDVLQDAGYQVMVKPDPSVAIPAVLARLPRLVVADIDFEEPALLQRLRQQNQIPLILLLSGEERHNEISGFRMGADDVITRPNDKGIFLARVSAVLGRPRGKGASAGENSDEPIVLGDLVVDPASHSASVADEQVELSPREFLLLYTLAREAGTVVSRDELLEQVWGPNFTGETQTIYVYINWLRKKLKAHAQKSHRIVTVHGVGYKLVPAETGKQS